MAASNFGPLKMTATSPSGKKVTVTRKPGQTRTQKFAEYRAKKGYRGGKKGR